MKIEAQFSFLDDGIYHFTDSQIPQFINKSDLNSIQVDQLNLVEYSDEAKIDLISWSTDEIKFKVDTESPQLVIFSEIFRI